MTAGITRRAFNADSGKLTMSDTLHRGRVHALVRRGLRRRFGPLRLRLTQPNPHNEIRQRWLCSEFSQPSTYLATVIRAVHRYLEQRFAQ